MPEELGERTEKPTSKRLSEARQRGQVPKSQDLSSAAMLLVGTLLVALAGWWLSDGFTVALRTLLDAGHIGAAPTTDSIGPSVKLAMTQAALLLGPIFAVAFAAAYATQVLQVGWLFTLKPVTPKLENLSPVKGFKKLFGLRGQVRTATSTLKLVVVVAVAAGVIATRLPLIAAMPRLDARNAVAVAVRMGLDLAFVLVVLLLLIAIVDYLYQRWQHTKDLMMTKQQVKDERRAMEGDPQVKGRRFRMYQQIMMQQIVATVPKADVVVNNPTHFSVAIRYDPLTMAAPRVTAKGADHLALRIRHLAAMHAVPMVTRPPLARALYLGTNVGDEVAPEHYEAIAEILAYVYRIDERSGRARTGPNRAEPVTARHAVA